MCLSLPSVFAFAFVGTFLCRAILSVAACPLVCLSRVRLASACVCLRAPYGLCSGVSQHVCLCLAGCVGLSESAGVPASASLRGPDFQYAHLPARLPVCGHASLPVHLCASVCVCVLGRGTVRGRLCVWWGWQRFKLNLMTVLLLRWRLHRFLLSA